MAALKEGESGVPVADLLRKYEALAIDAAMSIPSVRVIRVVKELVAIHARPEALRVDNGP